MFSFLVALSAVISILIIFLISLTRSLRCFGLARLDTSMRRFYIFAGVCYALISAWLGFIFIMLVQLGLS